MNAESPANGEKRLHGEPDDRLQLSFEFFDDLLMGSDSVIEDSSIVLGMTLKVIPSFSRMALRWGLWEARMNTGKRILYRGFA